MDIKIIDTPYKYGSASMCCKLCGLQIGENQAIVMREGGFNHAICDNNKL